MIDEIGSVDNIPEYINKAKDKDDPFRIIKFGHRCIKTTTPEPKLCSKPVMRCSQSWA